MYYHAMELKYVAWGKVGPAPEDALDPDYAHAYRWLGCHCGFFPQVWLAKGGSGITGFRMAHRDWSAKRRKRPEQVLFGFDVIKGFPVDYDVWVYKVLSGFMNAGPFRSFGESNKVLVAKLDHVTRWCRENDCMDGDPMVEDWSRHRELGRFLARWLFKERDQVVVPALNLKAAKRIICRDERQKKVLRRMGFIEDRIEIRNVR